MARRNPIRFAHLADRFGATASFVCALHCAALPLLLAVLPALGLGFLANHSFERGFIAFASVLALASLAFGFRRHRRFRAFWFLVPGVVLLIAGIVIDIDGRPLVHALLVSLGGMRSAVLAMIDCTSTTNASVLVPGAAARTRSAARSNAGEAA